MECAARAQDAVAKERMTEAANKHSLRLMLMTYYRALQFL